MRKTYMKPGINYESFELSENIAAGCGNTSSTLNQGGCPVYIAGRAVFTQSLVGVCTTYPANGSDEYFGICYYVPNSDSNVFES